MCSISYTHAGPHLGNDSHRSSASRLALPSKSKFRVNERAVRRIWDIPRRSAHKAGHGRLFRQSSNLQSPRARAAPRCFPFHRDLRCLLVLALGCCFQVCMPLPCMRWSLSAKSAIEASARARNWHKTHAVRTASISAASPRAARLRVQCRMSSGWARFPVFRRWERAPYAPLQAAAVAGVLTSPP